MKEILLTLLLTSSIARAQGAQPCAGQSGGITAHPECFMPEARAPERSRDPEMDPRTHLISLIKDADAAWAREEAAIIDLKKARDAFERKSDDANQVELIRQMRLRNEARTQTYIAYNQVITETIYFYNLTPKQTEFGGADGLIFDRPRWNPGYSDHEFQGNASEGWRRRTQAENLAEMQKDAARVAGSRVRPGTIAAETTQDLKRIRIFAGSFRDPQGNPNPDQVASYIVHETAHWLRFMSNITLPRDRRQAPQERLKSEHFAYAAQADFLESLGWAAGDTQFFRDRANHYQALAGKCSTGACPEVPASALPAMHPLEGPEDRTEPERDMFEKIKRDGDKGFYAGIGDLDAVTRAIRDAAKRRAEEERGSTEARTRDREIADRATWEYLKTVAGLACSNPDAFSKQAAAGKIKGASMDPILLTELMRADNGRLDECQAEVLRYIIHKDNGVLTGYIYWSAKHYKDTHPGFLSRMLTSLGDFVSSLLTYEGTSNGRSGGGSGTDHRGRGPGPVHIPTNPRWDGGR
jgi:hypothetical protein